MSLSATDDLAPAERGEDPQATFDLPWAALLVGLAVVEFVLLAVWQRNGYWDFSDGVYAQSAREFIHGVVPYRDFAAAQPPSIYLVGALLLAFHDGLASLRAGMAIADFATAALVGLCVWRLCRERWVAVVAAGLAPLLPISLHEHAQLTPETLAAPLLLGGALLCARQPRTAIGGALLAFAALCKFAFFIPTLVIALIAPARRKALLTVLFVVALLFAVSLAVFGAGVWRQTVEAQLQVGRASVHYVAGVLAQGVWVEVSVLILAAAAMLLALKDSELVGDPALLRTVAAAAGAGIVLVLTVFKRGSYINVLAVAEPPLLVLAACGATWCWRRGLWRPVVVVLAVLLAAQSLSLLIRPRDPSVAKRPGALSGLAWNAGPAAVDRTVSKAHRCPPGSAYSGDPYYAFLAGRSMPGKQPDLFMIQNAHADSGFAQRAAKDLQRCPPD